MNENSIGQLPQEGGKGSLIGSIIVVLILVIGAIYLYFNRTATPVVPANNETTTTETNTPVVSDEVEAIQSDAETTDLATLDTDLEALSQDFQ